MAALTIESGMGTRRTCLLQSSDRLSGEGGSPENVFSTLPLVMLTAFLRRWSSRRILLRPGDRCAMRAAIVVVEKRKKDS